VAIQLKISKRICILNLICTRDVPLRSFWSRIASINGCTNLLKMSWWFVEAEILMLMTFRVQSNVTTQQDFARDGKYW